MSQKLLLYPLCGGGHFLKWCLLLSPEQENEWPQHTESSNINYIRNHVYNAHRTWQNYLEVEREIDKVRYNKLNHYNIIIDHMKYDHEDVKNTLHTAWCYHRDEMARVAWQHFVDINLFSMAEDNCNWATAQDDYISKLVDETGQNWSYTNTEIKNNQYKTQFQNKDNAFFDIDWIWAGFDKKKYRELCEFFDLTPVVDQAEECWNIYADMRNEQIRTLHHWLENTLPDKLKYLKEIQYKYHTK